MSDLSKDPETPEQTETEAHVKGVEHAADSGYLTRRQAERVTAGTGQKGIKGHDLARGLRQRREE